MAAQEHARLLDSPLVPLWRALPCSNVPPSVVLLLLRQPSWTQSTLTESLPTAFSSTAMPSTTTGKLSSYIDFTYNFFYIQLLSFIRSGVMTDPTCTGPFKGCGASASTNHCTSLIGWGTDATSKKDYWILRNQVTLVLREKCSYWSETFPFLPSAIVGNRLG